MYKKMLSSDVAKLLDVTPDTVRQMERRGELSAERTISGTRLFDEGDVKRLASERAARKSRDDK